MRNTKGLDWRGIGRSGSGHRSQCWVRNTFSGSAGHWDRRLLPGSTSTRTWTASDWVQSWINLAQTQRNMHGLFTMGNRDKGRSKDRYSSSRGQWQQDKLRERSNLPTTLIGEAISKASHVIADGGPFCAAYHANVLNRKNGTDQDARDKKNKSVMGDNATRDG
ncbi:hypothetical protein NM208_g16299 [Fusarium decemcellulare]|uniref:Uncharacterized protein n=1 Tax=Fusarium decemcellulare TaxID=57161 RepID=A0ACC1RAK5_9HYPO|nr:hypothetical protein NM208_g16299 [Fusarium decemcellulare]